MVELRWLVKKNFGITAKQIQEYAAGHCVPMSEAKRTLIAETKPILQYKMDGIGTWLDVPVVVLPHGVGQ